MLEILLNFEEDGKFNLAILCILDLCNVIAWSTPLSETYHSHLIMSTAYADYYYLDWGGPVDFFGNPGLKNCRHRWGLNPLPEILVLSQVPMTSQPWLRCFNLDILSLHSCKSQKQFYQKRLFKEEHYFDLQRGHSDPISTPSYIVSMCAITHPNFYQLLLFAHQIYDQKAFSL